MKQPIIEIIVPTYKRHNNLLLLVNSFIVQTHSNWKMHIISDGIDDEKESLLKPYLEKYDNIKYTTINGPNKDWGHAAREYGLMSSNSDWVLMSGDDNYYTPKFIRFFTEKINENPKAAFIYCNMIHDHHKYNIIDSEIKRGKIDIGNFITRTDFAKNIGFKHRDYAADWHFINSYYQKYHKEYDFIKIKNILYVHN